MSTAEFVGSLGVDNVTTSFLDATNKLPLVISPRFDDSLEFLCHWLEANRSWVEEQMLAYGAVLIRGFQIDTAPEFEQAISSLQPNLSDSYRGTSPRSVFEGTKYTFSAADVPVNYPIGQHLEMAFLKSPPKQLYFGCLKESRSRGGETSLCDFRKVYQELDPAVRDKFEAKKVLYIRKHGKVGDKWTVDVGAMLSWTQMFGTSDQQEVETICQEEDAPEVQWIGPNKDTFFQEWKDDACQLHPVTKEKVWFNHAQVFHWSTFPAELWYAFFRIRDIRFLLRSIIIAIIAVIKYCLLGHRMALDIRFGDGSPISVSEMNQVRKVVHKNMVFSTWKKGDIMCIDNFSTSHGRQPTYDFGRKVLVAWSHSHDKTSTCSNPSVDKKNEQLIDDLKKCCGTFFDDACVPGAIEATPNPSPDSTLSSEEAQDLKDLIINQGSQDEKAKTGPHKRHISCPSPRLESIFS
jgi:alpha-ketoglutarate-dependent taurine dioxygenase